VYRTYKQPWIRVYNVPMIAAII